MNHKQTHRQNGLAAANGEAVEEGRIVNFRLLWLVVQSLSCVGLFRDPMDCSPPGSSLHGDSPAKNTGVGCHALLQGILLNQGLPVSRLAGGFFTI